MKPFNKVAIVGVGLIGGSVALAMKKKRLAYRIVGVSRHKSTLSLAKKIGAIDQGSQNINIVRNADLVILATPVSTIIKLAPAISKIITSDCIVSDAGSTKQEIVSKLERIFSRYVGSHPLAGSEKRGAGNACPDIFKGSLCILTPTKNTDKEALRKIKELWSHLGAGVLFFTPSIHDKILSCLSHLPHIAAFSLLNSIPKRYLMFAPSSLKYATRIALSDSNLWTDIFLSNQKNMLRSIGLFCKSLERIKSAIRKKDRKLLTHILKQAQRKREIIG